MDPVLTEVMKHRFAAIADEASNTVYRTAFTTFVKQTQDYQIALASLSGEFFASPIQSGMTSNLCHNLRAAVDEIGMDTLKPGDVIITNDPFSGNGLVTHIMDIHLIRPIFVDGEIICFSWSFIHASDVGGSVPGSISPTNYEVYQEGLRISPTLLHRQGELNQDLWRIFSDNTRIPDLIWGDVEAMMAGHLQLEGRIIELCERFGVAGVRTGIRDVMDLSELRAREVISEMTDGTFVFHDYLESYTPGQTIFVQASMTVRGDEIEISFAGSDPQLPLAMNLVTGNAKAHPFLCHALVNWLITAAPDMPRTGAMLRPVVIEAPRGSITNAEFPAAGGNRMVAVSRFYDVMLGCLDQAVPGGLAAAGAGIAGIIAASSLDPVTGKRHVSTVEPFMGGGGGRRNGDGLDAVDVPRGAIRSAPIETVEIEQPFIVRRFGIQPDRFGAGMHRGGGAVCLTLENNGPATTVTVRGLDRFEFEPWGLAGGRPGHTGSIIFNPGKADERNIGKLTVLDMKRGDVLHMITPTGGGYGSPLEREIPRVVNDILEGDLSVEMARRDYGVVVVDGVADVPATLAERAGRAGEFGNEFFSFGERRAKTEVLWPADARAELALAVGSVPSTLRHAARLDLALQVEALCQPVTAGLVRRVAAGEFASLPGS